MAITGFGNGTAVSMKDFAILVLILLFVQSHLYLRRKLLVNFTLLLTFAYYYLKYVTATKWEAIKTQYNFKLGFQFLK